MFRVYFGSRENVDGLLRLTLDEPQLTGALAMKMVPCLLLPSGEFQPVPFSPDLPPGAKLLSEPSGTRPWGYNCSFACGSSCAIGLPDFLLYDVSDPKHMYPLVLIEAEYCSSAKQHQMRGYSDAILRQIRKHDLSRLIGIHLSMPDNAPGPREKSKNLLMVFRLSTGTLTSYGYTRISTGICESFLESRSLTELDHVINAAMKAAATLVLNPEVNSRISLGQNVIHIDDLIYKVFDKRDRPLFACSPVYSLQFIQGAKLIVDTKEIQILSYPFIEGDHVPSSGSALVFAMCLPRVLVGQICDLILLLYQMAISLIAHGDILLRNVRLLILTTCYCLLT